MNTMGADSRRPSSFLFGTRLLSKAGKFREILEERKSVLLNGHGKRDPVLSRTLAPCRLMGTSLPRPR